MWRCSCIPFKSATDTVYTASTIFNYMLLHAYSNFNYIITRYNSHTSNLFCQCCFDSPSSTKLCLDDRWYADDACAGLLSVYSHQLYLLRLRVSESNNIYRLAICIVPDSNNNNINGSVTVGGSIS